MSLTLFQENVILSLFRDPFLIDPPESGTRQQMIFNFHATFRSANSNPSCTSTTWMPQNVTTTQRTNYPGKPSVRHRTFHVTCLSVSVVVFNCHMKLYCFLHIFKLWDHYNWLTAVVAQLPIKHLFIIHCSVIGEANKIKQYK